MQKSKKIALFVVTALFISSVSVSFAAEILKEKPVLEDCGCGCGKKKKDKWD
jgi:hypothetical protein